MLRSGGVAAAVVYGLAVAWGGVLWPGYRHLAQPVSDLIAVGAPSKASLDPLFALYNALTAAFGWGLLREFSAGPAGPTARRGRLGAMLLMAEALAGLLTQAFPEGQGGASVRIDLGGALHILCAATSSITSVLAVLWLGHALAARASRPWFWRYSLWSAVAIVATGVVAGVAVATGWAYAGLAERLTIGGFLAWLVVASSTRGAGRPAG